MKLHLGARVATFPSKFGVDDNAGLGKGSVVKGRRGRKGVSIGRDGSRESFHRKPRDSAAGTRTRGKRRESLLRASTVADEIICGIRSLWKRVSMGSCEIPGVLTRAIYHARSVFAYVVKGPRRLCRGHRVVECLLKFACLRILLPASPLFTLLYLRISLFHYASAFSLYVTTVTLFVAKNVLSIERITNFLSFYLISFPLSQLIRF